MALRLLAEAPNGCDLSAIRIAKIISERIFQVVIDQVTDEEDLIRILKSYVGDSEAEHIEASYNFPCVLLHCGPIHPYFGPPPPDQFALGPVTFQRFEAFLRNFNESVQNGSKRTQEKAIDYFSES